MSQKSEILKAQRNWAARSGLVPDAKGYLAHYEMNLFQPMNAATRMSFDQGSGSELKDSPRYPAKMRALHSSSALAVNFFDPWVAVDNQDLLRAFGIRSAEPCNIRFEAQYPTGLPGNPPNLDVALELSSAETIGVESKFTEWLTPKPKGRPPFKEKYFPAGQGLWYSVQLPDCQVVAEKLNDGRAEYRYLDVAQLLKHALGLATSLGRNFRLFYVYFDTTCATGEAHRAEIRLFADAVGEELRFQAISYQEALKSLEMASSGTQDYRNYLRSRYVPNAA